MTSSQKLKANQLNALKSTGPKSVVGRQRSSKNALKHGLSKGQSFDETQHQKAIMLANMLCEGQSISLYPHALELAQAQIQLSFVRSLKLSRFQSLPQSLFNPLNDNKPNPSDPLIQDPKIHDKNFDDGLQDVDRILSDIRKLERYERRAVRRLKLATKTFASSSFGKIYTINA